MGAIAQFAVWGAVVSGVMGLLWWRQVATKNASHVDVFWAGLIGLGALYLAATTPGPVWHRALVAAMAAVWGLRLAWHLHHRLAGKPEDARYASLRQSWTQAHFFVFFQFQTIAVLVFLVPVAVALRHPEPSLALDSAALTVWGVGVAGEAIADRQLAAFKSRSDSQGRTCRYGLWRYSRHPNYFFEWVQWWGYVVATIGSAWFPLSLLGPATMLYLLLRVTGIPMTERQALRSRGDDYRRYQQETSAFIPWFPSGPSPAGSPTSPERSTP